METLRQPIQKSEHIPIVTQRGRMIRVNLILPVLVGRMPRWLEILLTPYRERFAQEWCPTHWDALFRLSFMKHWQMHWGSVEGQEWLFRSRLSLRMNSERWSKSRRS
ncbi:MAG: hypothetical protein OJF51_000118 [Nitrospira sp.]|jgi:hypothetical protein|nr:MAG: hypothetical protein OJF51_000118 [Nitrospira sp.]